MQYSQNLKNNLPCSNHKTQLIQKCGTGYSAAGAAEEAAGADLAEKLKELQKEHKKHTARAPAGRRPGPRGPFSPEGRTGQTPRRSPTEPDYEWGRRRTKGRRPN